MGFITFLTNCKKRCIFLVFLVFDLHKFTSCLKQHVVPFHVVERPCETEHLSYLPNFSIYF